ncbi:hypothetical protein AC629_26065 [Bradyrhizobium sp. NAS80.1]|uniref:hypothetical protein n=1 Tax=Bradyrhizobium sp. NAS80.1 TaxID=1680159 RepID=UPI00095D5CFB|nr:hypothetical protein [Bradyrhizobium sp. NAS80.1]OKO81291.1 hypothetical protein AC629_26065 [Bradyrhizobium sp. NAS80.1]
MTNVSYTVPSNWTAGSDKTGASKNRNPNDPNMVTTGAYGNAFELLLDSKANADGTTTETLTYKSYTGKTNGSFSATAETGTGSDLSGAYQALLATLRANGEMDDKTAAQLNNAMGQLDTKSEGGTKDAGVSGGAMLVQAGGAGLLQRHVGLSEPVRGLARQRADEQAAARREGVRRDARNLFARPSVKSVGKAGPSRA